MSKIQELDTDLLTWRSIPSFLRDVFHTSWVKLLTYNTKRLNEQKRLFRSYARDQIIWGRSKLSVETLIRLRFNNDSIFLTTQIVNNVEFLVFPPEFNALIPFVGTPSDATTIVRPPNDPTIDLQQTQLTVEVPSVLQGQENNIHAFLKKYLHVGIIYEIVWT
ncbi:hypothetical protein MY04_4808 [Flammeovirga sp. MY04]|uniref:hypothetical protein n=1 Tax=Flammeovirga sp. MY04 TaxID=1191459 RepID=UPI00080622A7|nr:hypothetical protein [Flammeovirga sp. MY04]ANQ49625.1 hypothetical protein MY04_2251 [Flammeovirga sp. MY04]ANQ52143.1 hypothetical protein MY04_4808 [Flammeovirga sp. MY04]